MPLSMSCGVLPALPAHRPNNSGFGFRDRDSIFDNFRFNALPVIYSNENRRDEIEKQKLAAVLFELKSPEKITQCMFSDALPILPAHFLCWDYL